MKIQPLLLAALLPALAAPLSAGEFLIICSGQSNMAGVGPAAELPEDLKPVPANVAYFKQPDPAKPLEPLTSFGDGPKFGPVPSFAHALSEARPKDKFIILLDAVGGSSLMQWVPDYGPAELTTRINKGGATIHEKVGVYFGPLAQRIALIRKTYPEAKPLAFLWIQGESDKGPLAGAYLENFKRLVTNVRRETSTPDLLVIAGEPGLADDAVYEAFRGFVKADKNSALVEGLDLSHKQLHYGAKGYVELGKRFAAALTGRIPAGAR